MLYGRRQQHQSPRLEHRKQRSFILHQAFQYKYTWYMVTAVAGATLMFLVPAYYFISQNYQIFLNLAYDVQPRLLEHLEREMVWLKAFFVASFFVITGISMALGIRMTKMFIAPLVRMESHMRHLLLGQWHVPEYQVHEDEDFRDLSMTYDYFYRSLRATTESELKMLESLVIDPQNREAYAAWKTLMELKRSRLGITEPFIVRDEESSEVVPLRRVS